MLIVVELDVLELTLEAEDALELKVVDDTGVAVVMVDEVMLVVEADD